MIFKLEQILKKILYHLPIKFLLGNYILFESNPDYCDNSYYVCKELLKQGYNNKYKLIWMVKDRNKFNSIKIKNVKFVNAKSFKWKYYHVFAKYILDCNKYIQKYNKNQFRIHLGHGMPIKYVPSYGSSCGEANKYLLTSDFFVDFYTKYVYENRNAFIATGYPRNDQFFQEKEHFKELEGYSKIILWMPTYRKHLSAGIGYESKFIYGVPSINNEEEMIRLNEKLKEYNCLLIIKVHPAEDIGNEKEIKLSNILYTKDELLEKNNKNVYQLTQNSDALITDYSSMYYDYLMVDKPIGMAVEDINEYRKKFNLLFDDFEKDLPGEYIYNFNDLIIFVDNVCNNRDIKREERNKKRNLYIKYVDGNASKRIVDVLKENGL